MPARTANSACLRPATTRRSRIRVPTMDVCTIGIFFSFLGFPGGNNVIYKITVERVQFLYKIIIRPKALVAKFSKHHDTVFAHLCELGAARRRRSPRIS